MAVRPEPSTTPQRVIVAGGGIAGAEALLALRQLAGERISLTLVTPDDELVLPALSVAESFARGHAERYPLAPLLESVGAEIVLGNLAAVEPDAHQINLEDGSRLDFDALVVAVGGRAVARVEHATTWWPGGDGGEFAGVLKDLEEGYTKRVAFVIPSGAVWPLPLYELALMTARQVDSVGITDAQLTVVTPEAVPLALFGASAAVALHDELERVGVRLETASVARVETGPPLEVVLQPSTRRLQVDRVVALPGVEGPRIPGTTQNDEGFIRVGEYGRIRGSDSIWAAGDAIAYPVKFGGIATQQADLVAADIAARAGARVTPAAGVLHLRGVLMTGSAPRPLGAADTEASAPPAEHRPIWLPDRKVFGEYLTPYLERLREPSPAPGASEGVVVDETLPGPEHGESQTFHALWRSEHGSDDYLGRLGRRMHDYDARHRQASTILREQGQLRGPAS